MGQKNSTIEYISIKNRKKIWNQLDETTKDSRIYRKDRYGNELSYPLYNKKKTGAWKIIYINPFVQNKNNTKNLEIVHYNVKTTDNTIFKIKN